MNFLSVCSGIEAASVAWLPLGWRAVAFSEIEPFPCAVLAHHYPNTPNWGDMTKFKDWPDAAFDLLCGGTPCQAFSVAGLRKGLADPRGNLMLTFGAIAARYRPRWLVWENVPGVLSSNDGRDFGAFLGMLGQLGYGFAYRVLDAQHFGVPQRRRRVFVVGCLGDWRSAAAVLFERHSLQGHPAPRRETGQGAAPTIAARAGSSSGPGIRAECDGGAGLIYPESETMVPVSVDIRNGVLALDGPTQTMQAAGLGSERGGNPNAMPHVLAFDTTQVTSNANRSNPKPGDPYHPLAAGAHAPAIAFDCKSSGQNGFGIGVELAGTQRAMGHADSHTNGGGHQAVAYVPDIAATMVARSSRGGGQINSPGHQADTELIASAMKVRRLTPRECERLQGFPEIHHELTITVCKNEGVRRAAAQSSAAPSHEGNRPVAVRVRIDCERLEVRLLNPARSHSSASNAVSLSWCPPSMQAADFAQLLAATVPCVVKETQAGRVESLLSTSRSSGHLNGSASVHLCGRESDALASDAARFTTEMGHSMKCITSQAGRGSPNYEQHLKTLCCCVVAAISSSIPDSIRAASSFDVIVEAVSSYTNVPWRGKPAADGPRYKALGNSWAVPCARWIGERINAVDAVAHLREAA